MPWFNFTVTTSSCHQQFGCCFRLFWDAANYVSICKNWYVQNMKLTEKCVVYTLRWISIILYYICFFFKILCLPYGAELLCCILKCPSRCTFAVQNDTNQYTRCLYMDLKINISCDLFLEMTHRFINNNTV
jgi:hypothetical protein